MIIETLSSKRKHAGLSRKMLADSVGVSTQFIRLVELGEKTPSLKTASKLATALSCTVDDLLGKRDSS